MNIRVHDGLPYVTATITYGEHELSLPNVLLDTGSASTLFATDRLLEIGLAMEAHDPIYRIRGVGGTEFVFGKRIDALALGALVVRDFEIEVGALAYGLDLDGILGMDFLLRLGAVIDLVALQVRPATP